ncbi:MAG: energy transducer TonB [Bdellovibrionaceae bacterium]|nr:energy transducer TonB [Pseudobdellovibrionaceae bacterium]MDW8190681.1 energy transducer TonB [Pseudobdellovibrionaceae bacterium]
MIWSETGPIFPYHNQGIRFLSWGISGLIHGAVVFYLLGTLVNQELVKKLPIYVSVDLVGFHSSLDKTKSGDGVPVKQRTKTKTKKPVIVSPNQVTPSSQIAQVEQMAPQDVVSIDQQMATHKSDSMAAAGDAINLEQLVLQRDPKDPVRLYLEKVYRQLLRHQRYPLVARQMGIEGLVKVVLSVDQNGYIADLKVLESSHDILTEGTLANFRRIQRLLPPPKELTVAELHLIVPVRFRLNE